jgi:two-component system, sensor histidine kinase RpfC
MTLRQEAASSPAPPLGRRERLAAAGLALYAVIAPLTVAALAGPLPLRYAGTFALALSLLGPGLATILAGWRGLGTIAQDLAARSDGEPQQALVRLFVSGAALAYIGALAAAGLPFERVQPLLAVDVVGALAAWLVFLAVMLGPAPRRRAFVMAGDIVLISVFLHYGAAAAAPWVSAYLWVSLGSGWRQGAPMLLAAALLGAACFAGVVLTTPFWRALPTVDGGILVALIVPAASAAAFVHRLGGAVAEAETARTARSRLLAVMSHELRTPLNALIGMGALLARTRLDAEQRDMLGTMQLSARTLLGLINDLLDLSRLEAGKLAAKTESFVLREVLGGAVAILRPQAEAKGLELALSVDPRLPHVCRGLPLQLRQVLMNLLANAIKFTPRGHVGVAATLAGRGAGTARLRLAVRDEGIGVPAAARERIFHIFAQGDDTVPDRYGGTGLGLAIAKQLIDLMGGTITLESELGAGSTFTVELPLACEEDANLRPPDLMGRRVVIVTPDRELAGVLQIWLRAWRAETQWYIAGDDALTVLGGEPGAAQQILLIDGRSDPVAGLSLAHRFGGGGRRPSVVFIAPAQASEAVAGLAATQLAAAIEAPVTEAALTSASLSVLAMAAEEETAPPPAAAKPRSLRVLVAEDDAASREVLRNLLGRAGHQVEFASEGGAALAALDKGGFDLALLDLNMPGVSGDAVAKLHRLRHPGDFVPLIALTADATEETELMCREAGFDTVLTKPVEAARLLAAIDETGARRVAAPQSEAGPVVTPITDHPRFGSETVEVIDTARIEALSGLGGHEFVADVVETFVADAARILARLKQAIEHADIGEFAELTHSLRSGAANLGAARLCQTLTALEDVTAKDLRQAGSAYFEKIETEVRRLELALDQFGRNHRHA